MSPLASSVTYRPPASANATLLTARLDRIEKQLSEALGRLRSEEFPAISGDHCKNCGFTAICPVKGAKDEMAAIDPELAENQLIFPDESVLAKSKVFMALNEAEERIYEQKFQQVIGA